MVSQTPGSKFIKFGEWVSISQTPNAEKFCCAPTEVCEISAIKNLCSRKSGPKFIKIGDDLLHTNIVPHSITLDQTYEKSITKFFYTLQYFGTPGDLLCQSSPISALMYIQQGPFYQPAKFCPVLKTHVPDICCPISSISLTMWLTKNSKCLRMHTMWDKKH